MPPCLPAGGRAGALHDPRSAARGAARSDGEFAGQVPSRSSVSERLQPFDAQDVSVVKAFLPPRALGRRDHLVEQLNWAAKG
jgi:hypothetical protein